jgi:hypothetical protein
VIKAVIDFGINVKFILMKGTSLFQYTTFDYSSDTLSYLYALMKEKNISEITYCLPSYFSKEILLNSVALSHETLAFSDGYFCVSLEDLSKLKHLAESLHISNVHYTEQELLCTEDGIYAMECNNLCRILVKYHGKIIECDMQTESTATATIQQYYLKYNLHNIVNLVNHSDYDLLPTVFDNIFAVDNVSVTNDLTYLAWVMQAEWHTIDDYFASPFSAQTLVTDDTSATSDADLSIAKPSANVRKSSEALTKVDDQDDTETSAMSNATESRSSKSHKVKNHADNVKKPAKKSFLTAITAVIAIAMILNVSLLYLRNSENKKYTQEYASFLDKSSQLTDLKSKYNLLSSVTTTETSSGVLSFLKDTKLLKSKNVKLTNFAIEGSTITLTVTAPSDTKFWAFHDKLGETYNITNVTDGDPPKSGVCHVITLML